MLMKQQPSFLSSYISTYEHPLTTAQRKLDELVEKIESCKFALRSRPLDSRQSLMARQLVASLDQGIEELATQITGRLSTHLGGANGVEIFDEHMLRLTAICRQLSAAVLGGQGCCSDLA